MKGPQIGGRPAVAYLRVSTKSQGESGLGVDAQRSTVRAYCLANGLRLIDEYREVESGSTSSRPVLHDAIARAHGTGAVLVIARLDRLSRSARFIAELLESELPFVACDVPSANRLVLQILAAIAEEEARATSIRTRAAMQAAKERGAVFGTPANLTAEARHRGVRASTIARRAKRDRTLGTVAKRLRNLRSEGFGYKQIAAILNDEQYKTSTGKRWRGGGVWRALRRLRAREGANE